MAEKIKIRINTETGYKTLYPETSSSQVIDLNTGQPLDVILDQMSSHLNDIPPKLLTLVNGEQKVVADYKSLVKPKLLKGRTIINYAPLFDSGAWGFSSDFVVNSPSKVTLTVSDGANHGHYVVFPVKANSDYTFNVKHNANIAIYKVDGTPIQNYTSDQVITFNTGTETSIRIYFRNPNLTNGTFTFEEPMLNEGTEPKPFVANVQGITNPTITDVTKKLIKANFEGKVRGSTVENPHIMKVAWASPLRTPTQFTIETTNTNYSNILKLDGVFYSNTTAVNSQQAQTLFSFNLIDEIERKIGKIPKSTVADKIQWLKDNVASLICDWYGYGSSVGGNKASFKWWKNTTNTWEGDPISTVHTQNKVSKIRNVLNFSWAKEQCIDSNGFVHFLAYAEPSDGVTPSTISTDYVELKIELKPTALYGIVIPKSCTLLGTFHEGDVVSEDKGQYSVLRAKREVLLGGSEVWALSRSFTGFKSIYMTSNAYKGLSGIVSKYNGKILSTVTLIDDADQLEMNATYGAILSIPNNDSGWGDSYTPTADEIKAYFLGWRMYNANVTVPSDTSGNLPQYTGATGEIKGWAKIDTSRPYGWRGGTGTRTLPTVLNDLQGWKPYKLLYDLASPVKEPVQAINSVLKLAKGDNALQVSEGRIVREKANVVYNSKYAFINSTLPGYEKSRLKYKTSKILSVYKNGELDTNWIHLSDPVTYGNERVYIPITNFDKIAVYTVDYEPLYLSEVTVPVDNITIEYRPNIASVVDSLIDSISEQAIAIDGVNSILPIILGGIIEESGETSLGRYVRYSDGTMICYRQGAIVNMDNVSTKYYTFPAKFISPATVFIGIADYLNDTNRSVAHEVIVSSRARPANAWEIYNASIGSGDMYVNLLAVGRWK